ncbi:MAG: ketopantoate reductase family protein [Omnitrophica WOR_2 bacterium]
MYGAGALGSLCAARMAEAGKYVTLLARGKRAEDRFGSTPPAIMVRYGFNSSFLLP